MIKYKIDDIINEVIYDDDKNKLYQGSNIYYKI